MTHVPSGAPWSERGGRLRGVVDLVAGRYPAFLFGAGVGRALPAFHFHESTPEALTPVFGYLAENGYTAVTTDALDDALAGRPLPPRAVLLAFDDAWASLWTVVAPLLRRYGLRAVAYAIPARIIDAATVRPALGDAGFDPAADRSATPFVTWPELRALASSGLVDVQSHTWSHSMIFCGRERLGVVDAAYAGTPLLTRPRLNAEDPPAFLQPDALGAPVFPRRSRMADAPRYVPETDRFETGDEQRAAIEHELAAGRDVLAARLQAPVAHVCLPWGVTGDVTRAALARLGVRTAIANQWAGRYVISAASDRFHLKRLNSRHVFALPGRGRRPFVTFA